MEKYLYKAFISYRHSDFDKEAAKRLQKLLESYKPPKEYRPDEKWRVFRDESELPTSSDLSANIKSALERSEFLIVVCSPRIKASRWCNEEISCFKQLHGGSNKNIITLIIEGEPDEVFPEEICKTVLERELEDGRKERFETAVEPLAADIRADSPKKALKKLKGELLRIAAPLLGCGYDDLYNRSQRDRIRRRMTVSAAALFFLAAFGIYNSFMLFRISQQRSLLAEQSAELDKKQAELSESYEALSRANDELDSVNNELEIKNASLINTKNELEENNKALDETNELLELKNKEAEESLRETNEQKRFAANSLELLRQKSQELRINNVKALADKAESEYDSGDRLGAVKTALSLRPYEDDPNRLLPSTVNFLTKALNLYVFSNNPQLNGRVKTYGEIRDLVYSPDGKMLLAYDNENRVYVWDVKTLKELYRNSTESFVKAGFSADNNLIVVDSSSVSKIDLNGKALICKLDLIEEDEFDFVSGAAFCGDCSVLTLWSEFMTNKMYFVDTESCSLICSAELSDEINLFYAEETASWENKCFSAVDFDNNIIHFDLNNKVYSVVYKGEGEIRAFTYVSENIIVAAETVKSEEGSLNRLVKIDLKNKSADVLSIEECKTAYIKDIMSADVERNGEVITVVILIGIRDIYLIDLENEYCFDTTEYNKSIENVYFAETGNLAVLCSDGSLNYLKPDGSLAVSDMLKFGDERLDKFIRYNRFNYAVVRDSRTVVVYADVKDYGYKSSIEAKNAFYDLFFSQDGRYFGIFDNDNNLYIYDAETKNKLSCVEMGGRYFYKNGFAFYKNYILYFDSERREIYDVFTGKKVRSINLTKDYGQNIQINALDEGNKIIAVSDECVFNIDERGERLIADFSPCGSLVDYNFNSGGTICALLLYKPAQGGNTASYCLYDLDLNSGELKLLWELENTSGDKAYAGGAGNIIDIDDETGEICIMLNGNIYTLGKNGGLKTLEGAVDDIAAKKVCFAEGYNYLVVFGDDGKFYILNRESGALEAKIASENYFYQESFAESLKERNQIVIYEQNGNKLYFIDMENLEIRAQVSGVYNHKADEIAAESVDGVNFYGYYTDEEIIKRAAEIIS